MDIEESIRQSMIAAGWRQCAKGQRTTQYCGLTEQAKREAKREALLEAAGWFDVHTNGGYVSASPFNDLRRMADELKD
jgi:hypothetical protein